MPGISAKNTKKRPAPSQQGPKSKKAHVEKNEQSNDKSKKRSKPVTAPIQKDSDVSSEEEDELVGEDGVDLEEAEEMEVDSQPQVPKDPNGTSCLSMSYCAIGIDLYCFKLPESRIKHNVHFWISDVQRNRTLYY